MNILERKDILEQKLQEYGLELRDDSRLCTRYLIFGRGNAEDIARTMNEMEFFFKHTGYRRAIGVIRRENWPYSLDRDRLSTLAKRRALRWLVRSEDETTLGLAPETLEAEIQIARRIVGSIKQSPIDHSPYTEQAMHENAESKEHE